MKKETIATILGFFVLGLLYVGINKKVLSAIIGLTVISYALTYFLSPGFSLVANIAGAYLGNKWMKEKLAAEAAGVVVEEEK